MTDSTTSSDLPRELGVHHGSARSCLREYSEKHEGHAAPEALTQGPADAFLAWHATRFGTSG